MSDMPEHPTSSDVHTQLGPRSSPSVEELREEIRALAAVVREQQRALDQIGTVESEAMALTRSLPDRLGSAIAAAVEARQAAFLLEAERAGTSLKASLRDLASQSESLAGRVDDRRSEITDAAARVVETSERVDGVAGQIRSELGRLEERIAQLPDVAGAVVDDRVTGLVERVTRLSEQLDRHEARDIPAELRSRFDQIRSGLHDAVRQEVAAELARAVQDLSERIDEARPPAGLIELREESFERIERASAAPVASLRDEVEAMRARVDELANEPRPLASDSFDRLSEHVTAALAPTLTELSQSLSMLLARNDPAEEVRQRIADLTGQLRGAEERLAARVQATDRSDEIEHKLTELVELAGAHTPLDDLQASVQRLAAVIRELATRDETAVAQRLEAIADRLQRPDHTADFHQLHERIDALWAREEPPDPRPQLAELSRALAEIAARPDPPDHQEQLQELTDRIAGLTPPAPPPDPSDALDRLREGLDALARQVEELASPDDLRSVRDDVAGARIAGEQSAEVASVMAQRVDDRLDELAARVSGLTKGTDPEAVTRLETRIDELAVTVDEIAAAVKKLRRPPLRAKRKASGAQEEA